MCEIKKRNIGRCEMSYEFLEAAIPMPEGCRIVDIRGGRSERAVDVLIEGPEMPEAIECQIRSVVLEFEAAKPARCVGVRLV